MYFRNKPLWDSIIEANQDAYGKSTVDYARRWAELLEERLHYTGRYLEREAEQASHDADTDGITGFMFGKAVSILAEVWFYGPQLRDWHNAQYGVRSASTVNPAVLSQ